MSIRHVLPLNDNPWLLAFTGLVCNLYPYQRRALAWMVWREQQASAPSASVAASPPSAAQSEELQTLQSVRMLLIVPAC